MKIIQYTFLAFFMLTLVGCTKNLPKKPAKISSTNQAPTEKKFVKKTTTKTEIAPDGTVLVVETTVYEDAKGRLATSVSVEEGYEGQPTIDVPETPRTTPTTPTFEEVPRVPPSTLPKPRDNTPSITTRSIDTAQDAAFMTERARQMIKEINLVRANPRAYIREVQAYRERIKNTEFSDLNYAKELLRSIDDLIRELQIMSPMPTLQPRLKLYKTTQKHGIELLTTNTLTSVGTDGSYPWDRIKRDDPTLEDGNENLIGGAEDVKESLMMLLVDAGVQGYGRRRNILNPTWKYVACYEIGEINGTPNCWIQSFAK